MANSTENIPRLSETVCKDWFVVRNATPDDCPAILQYIKDLAVYEEESESIVEINDEVLKKDGFEDSPSFGCIVAEEQSESQKVIVGYSIYVNSYSTWKGRSLWIEDLFVRPDSRGKGIGLELLKCLSKIALDNGMAKIRCNVLSWNKIAISFYNKIGGIVEEDWRQCMFSRETMKDLVNSSVPTVTCIYEMALANSTENIPRLSETVCKDWFVVRNARPDDCPVILQYMKDSTVYHEEPESLVEIDEEDIKKDGFGDSPSFRCIVAEEQNESQKVIVGYSIYVNSYSTWKGRSLWIEDLFVRPDSRGKGIGLELLKCLSKIALDNGMARIRCNVLSWNKIAISFYNKIGGIVEEDWRQCMFSRETMKDLANS